MNIGTPYDNAFRILLTENPQLIIPVVNEMFGESYSMDEKVVINQNEHYVIMRDGERRIRVTDSRFTIGTRSYHIECQSTGDSDMIMRMFEYDFQIGKAERVRDNGEVCIRLPRSGIIYLRKDASDIDSLRFGDMVYEVESLNIFDHSFDQLLEKKLYFLVPFHVFVYEGSFREYNEDIHRLREFGEEYSGLWDRAGAALKEDGYGDSVYVLLYEQGAHILRALARKYDSIMKEVVEPMFGVYHESETRKAMEQGMEAGRAEGIKAGRAEGIKAGRAEGMEAGRADAAVKLMNNARIPAEQAMDMLGIEGDERARIMDLIQNMK